MKSVQLAVTGDVTTANFAEAMQQAIEIEIATIPVYLYTYYSIIRDPLDQSAVTATLTTELENAGKDPQDAAAIALELSTAIMVFGNQAGALIMSVVIEEMLHMALSSNVKQALVGPPQLVGKSPSGYPIALPGHEPPFPINLAKLSLDQLYTFMQIESPHELVDTDQAATAIEYTTIGEFYGAIQRCIDANYQGDDSYDSRRPQLTPGNGYYAHNNIDTVYYDRMHKPHFVNADDSGDLIWVNDHAAATQAITDICEQGEGNQARGFGPGGTVRCDQPDGNDYDDPLREERDHFAKFNQIYCRYERLTARFNAELGVDDYDISRHFVLDVPSNPVNADYPDGIQAVNQLTNAIYTYIFVMTENCYRTDGNTQYETFMFGIHKSMIFLLNSLCGNMTGYHYISQQDGREYTAACTFEDYSFSASSSPKSQILQLFDLAVGVDSSLAGYRQRILDLPDVPLEPYLSEAGTEISFA
jgi:hypothetical protein